MLHAAELLLLNSRVDRLLASDPQMPLRTSLQSRAETLPLAQQHMLVLAAVCQLQHAARSAIDIDSTSAGNNLQLFQSSTKQKLLQLLQLLSVSPYCSNSTRQIASMAIKQHQVGAKPVPTTTNRQVLWGPSCFDCCNISSHATAHIVSVNFAGVWPGSHRCCSTTEAIRPCPTSWHMTSPDGSSTSSIASAG
jgi:hypothetical protein